MHTASPAVGLRQSARRHCCLVFCAKAVPFVTTLLYISTVYASVRYYCHLSPDILRTHLTIAQVVGHHTPGIYIIRKPRVHVIGIKAGFVQEASGRIAKLSCSQYYSMPLAR